MVSSSNYQNMIKIQQFFTSLLQLPNYIIILGAGSTYGADSYIKKLALELELGYKEFNPYHTPHNSFSAMPKYRYGKKFATSNFATRYKHLTDDCDKLIVFQDKNRSDAFINAIEMSINKGKITYPAVVLYE